MKPWENYKNLLIQNLNDCKDEDDFSDILDNIALSQLMAYSEMRIRGQIKQ